MSIQYMCSTYLVLLKRPCGSLKVRVQQIWLGDASVRSGTPGTSETGTDLPVGGCFIDLPSYYHELWVSKYQRVSKCNFLRDHCSELADLCLDI
jgi:hypothetical protein